MYMPDGNTYRPCPHGTPSANSPTKIDPSAWMRRPRTSRPAWNTPRSVSSFSKNLRPSPSNTPSAKPPSYTTSLADGHSSRPSPCGTPASSWPQYTQSSCSATTPVVSVTSGAAGAGSGSRRSGT